MKNLVLFVLILFFSLIQTTFLPINFLLVFVIIISLWQETPQSFLWAFLAGFFLDLFSLKPLGISSIIFVSFDFLLKVYRQRFSLEQPLVMSLVLLFSYFVFSLMTGREIKIWEGLILLVFLWLARSFRRDWFFSTSVKESSRLKL